jgi:hypothetical protein
MISLSLSIQNHNYLLPSFLTPFHLSLSLQIPSATIFGWVAEGILLGKMKKFLVPRLILLASTLSFCFSAARLPDAEGIFICYLNKSWWSIQLIHVFSSGKRANFDGLISFWISFSTWQLACLINVALIWSLVLIF